MADLYFPPELVNAIIQVESSGNPEAVSPVGAVGLMQLLPDTAALYGYTEEDLLDPDKNIEAGLEHLNRLAERYGGNRALALAAYHAGEGNIDKLLRGEEITELGPNSRAYVSKVLSLVPHLATEADHQFLQDFEFEPIMDRSSELAVERYKGGDAGQGSRSAPIVEVPVGPRGSSPYSGGLPVGAENGAPESFWARLMQPVGNWQSPHDAEIQAAKSQITSLWDQVMGAADSAGDWVSAQVPEGVFASSGPGYPSYTMPEAGPNNELQNEQDILFLAATDPVKGAEILDQMEVEPEELAENLGVPMPELVPGPPAISQQGPVAMASNAAPALPNVSPVAQQGPRQGLPSTTLEPPASPGNNFLEALAYVQNAGLSNETLQAATPRLSASAVAGTPRGGHVNGSNEATQMALQLLMAAQSPQQPVPGLGALIRG